MTIMSDIETGTTVTQHTPIGNGAGAGNPMLTQQIDPAYVLGTMSLQAPISHAEEIQRIATARKEQISSLLILRRDILKAREERVTQEDRELAAIAEELGEETPPVATLDSARARPGKLPAFNGQKLRTRVGSTKTGGAPAKKPGVPRKPSGRLARRSIEQIDQVVDKVVKLVKAFPEGLRAETIREDLSLEAKELPRVFRRALQKKLLKAKGQKRATTYFAGAKA